MKKNILITILSLVCVGLFIYATSVSSAKLTSKLEVSEPITTGTISQDILHSVLKEVVNYRNGESKYDVDLVYADTVKGTQTIDMTSLQNTLGQSLDLSNQRIVAAKFKSRLTNAGTIVIEPGASNGYDLFGASFKLTLEPGQSILYKADTVLDEIGASDLALKFTCGSDTLDWMIITADLN